MEHNYLLNSTFLQYILGVYSYTYTHLSSGKEFSYIETLSYIIPVLFQLYFMVKNVYVMVYYRSHKNVYI